MKLDDYNKLFDNCAKDKMVMEKYQPVKDQIIRICKHYIAKKEFKNNVRVEVRNHKKYNKNKIDFIRDLLRLFNRVIKEKKYDNLDQIIDWLLANPEVTYYYFLTFFKVLVFKMTIYLLMITLIGIVIVLIECVMFLQEKLVLIQKKYL